MNMLAEMGIETGINLMALVEAVREAERTLKMTFLPADQGRAQL